MLDRIHAALEALKLRTMRETVAEELRRAQGKKTSYSAFLLGLLEAEHAARTERLIENRIRQSGVPERWSLDTYPFHVQTCISKKEHLEFAELDFIDRAENVVWVGGTGVGKTGLATSILLKAITAGRTGRMIKAQQLFEDFGASRETRTTHALLKRLARLDVLAIDELGYMEPKPDQVNNFFRLVESRYGKKPILITTNLGYKQWPSFLGNAPLANALLRRLLHSCHTVVFRNGVNLSTPKYQIPATPDKA